MNNIFTALIITSALGFSSMSSAASLSKDMHVLGSNYKAFNQAKTNGEAVTALEQMRVAALDAKAVKLKSKVKGEKNVPATVLFDQLIQDIDQTKALVEADQLDLAKQEGKKLLAIRDQGHKIYK